MHSFSIHVNFSPLFCKCLLFSFLWEKHCSASHKNSFDFGIHSSRANTFFGGFSWKDSCLSAPAPGFRANGSDIFKVVQ